MLTDLQYKQLRQPICEDNEQNYHLEPSPDGSRTGNHIEQHNISTVLPLYRSLTIQFGISIISLQTVKIKIKTYLYIML